MTDDPRSLDAATQSGRYRAVSVGFDDLVTEDPAFRRVLDKARRVATTDVNLLLEGESGTGKNFIAQAVHNASARARRPFVEVNGRELPEALAGSLLFGHVRGAFTGSLDDRMGWFERANGGTIFLDEITNLPMAIQAKLLRVLESRQVVPLGAAAAKTVSVRVVAASNRDVEREVSQGRFRAGLVYRLGEMRLTVPPLRERRCDVRPLVGRFLADWSTKYGHSIQGLEPLAWALLEAHDFPGNVRELRNLVRRGAALAEGDRIRAADLDLCVRVDRTVGPAAHARSDYTLEAAKREHVAFVMNLTQGNKLRAAALLGISRNTLDRLLRDGAAARDADRSAAE